MPVLLDALLDFLFLIMFEFKPYVYLDKHCLLESHDVLVCLNQCTPTNMTVGTVGSFLDFSGRTLYHCLHLPNTNLTGCPHQFS